MKVQGKAFVFGDDVDTDQIVPGRYLQLVDPKEIAAHAMEGADPTFVKRFEKGSIVVGAKNFGCGSSREHAPIALKTIGVSCVIAESFGRIFFRNAINIGLPVLRCPGISGFVQEGDLLSVDVSKGTVTLPNGKTIQGEKLGTNIIDMLNHGGLIPFVKAQLEKEDSCQ